MKIDEYKLTNASPNKRFIIGTFEEKAQDGNAISFYKSLDFEGCI